MKLEQGAGSRPRPNWHCGILACLGLAAAEPIKIDMYMYLYPVSVSVADMPGWRPLMDMSQINLIK